LQAAASARLFVSERIRSGGSEREWRAEKAVAVVLEARATIATTKRVLIEGDSYGEGSLGGEEGEKEGVGKGKEESRGVNEVPAAEIKAEEEIARQEEEWDSFGGSSKEESAGSLDTGAWWAASQMARRGTEERDGGVEGEEKRGAQHLQGNK